MVTVDEAADQIKYHLVEIESNNLLISLKFFQLNDFSYFHIQYH